MQCPSASIASRKGNADSHRRNIIMRRLFFILLIATACYCVGMPAIAATCTSLQAQCAVKAGGKCDPQTGHWCYGRSREGEWCGGSVAAFRTCMARLAAASRVDPPATANELGKCTSIQARCVIEAGSYCDRRSGHWRLGFVFQHNYGGNQQAFIACIDRAMAARK
jgi:hypothetical protein